jgi:acyl-CoA dehydrogenase family protein 9
VDKDFGGITPGAPEKKLGIRGSNTCVVTFENCFVPNENVLGKVGDGFKNAVGILNNGRFGLGAASGSGIRKMIQLAGDYANNRIQFGQPIANFGMIREKFARMALDAYACESMAYMTTGLIDGKGMDCSVEAAACKIYGSEAIFNAVNDCIQILGGMGFSAGGSYPFERLLRDSRILLIFEGTNEILRLFIALTCLQGAGAELKHLSSNPMANASQLLALMRNVYGVAPALPTDVAANQNVAPQLAAEAKGLTDATILFQRGIYKLLSTYGKAIIEPDNQLVLQRAANAAIDLYGWQCILARCSAAVHPNSPTKVPAEDQAHELKLAKGWIARAEGRIQTNMREMTMSKSANGDKNTIDIATDVLKAGKYLAAHPIRV